MPPTRPTYPFLSTEPVIGVPFYRQVEHLHHAPSLPPHQLTSSIPLEAAGNMLGAKARAAEYNAAKAATARQQASQDADEQQIPMPGPVSLSAFTRNVSGNRNKGNKTFVPLVLSEDEEQKSTNSMDQGSEETSMSPTTAPVEGYEPPRAASLPPPRTFLPTPQAKTEKAIQTPQRYREPHASLAAPRPVHADELYTIHQQFQQPFYQKYLSHAYHNGGIVPQSIASTPAVPWYAPNDYLAGPFQYNDMGMQESESHDQARPVLYHQQNHARPKKTEQFEELKVSKDVIPPRTPEMGHQGRRVFGPDDLSPAKAEVKMLARQTHFAKHPEDIVCSPEMSSKEEISSTNLTQRTDEASRTSASQGMILPFRQPCQPTTRSQFPKQKYCDLSPRQKTASWVVTNKMQEQRQSTSDEETLIGSGEGDWPYLGRPFGFVSRDRALPKPREVRGDEAGQTQMMDLDSMTSASSRAARPPPGLKTPSERAKAAKTSRSWSEQLTDVKFPLVDVPSTEWFDFGPPTVRQREQTRLVCRQIRAAEETSDSTEDTEIADDEEELSDLHDAVESAAGNYVRKLHHINQVVDAMCSHEQSRSKVSTSSGSQRTSKDEEIVRAVGGIMAALYMYTDTGSHQGTRPYCQPAEYAIDRNAERDGKFVSLFEQEGEDHKPPPLRLARDPRFRAHMSDGMRHAIEDGRIPRMFVARRGY